MVQLVDSDIKTREALDWKGVHVLHQRELSAVVSRHQSARKKIKVRE